MFAPKQQHVCALLLLYSVYVHATSPAMVDVNLGQCIDGAYSLERHREETSLIQTKMIKTQRHKADAQTEDISIQGSTANAMSRTHVGVTRNHAQITNGAEVVAPAFPWVVLIFAKQRNTERSRPYCTATSIGGEWLLTAKHCKAEHDVVVKMLDPEDLQGGSLVWDLWVGKGCKPSEDAEGAEASQDASSDSEASEPKQKIRSLSDCAKQVLIANWHEVSEDRDIAVFELTENLEIDTPPKLAKTPAEARKAHMAVMQEGQVTDLGMPYGLGYWNGVAAQKLQFGLTKLLPPGYCQRGELWQPVDTRGNLGTPWQRLLPEGAADKVLCGVPYTAIVGGTIVGGTVVGGTLQNTQFMYAQGDSGGPLLGGTLAIEEDIVKAPVGTQTQIGVVIGAYDTHTKKQGADYVDYLVTTRSQLFVDVATFYEKICDTCQRCASCQTGQANQAQEDQSIEPIEDNGIGWNEDSGRNVQGDGNQIEKEEEKEPRNLHVNAEVEPEPIGSSEAQRSNAGARTRSRAEGFSDEMPEGIDPYPERRAGAFTAKRLQQ